MAGGPAERPVPVRGDTGAPRDAKPPQSAAGVPEGAALGTFAPAADPRRHGARRLPAPGRIARPRDRVRHCRATVEGGHRRRARAAGRSRPIRRRDSRAGRATCPWPPRTRRRRTGRDAACSPRGRQRASPPRRGLGQLARRAPGRPTRTGTRRTSTSPPGRWRLRRISATARPRCGRRRSAPSWRASRRAPTTRQIVTWLTGWDDPTCRTIASLMWRCRLAGGRRQEQGHDDRDNARARTRARTAARTMAAATGHPVLREHWLPDPQAHPDRRRAAALVRLPPVLARRGASRPPGRSQKQGSR